LRRQAGVMVAGTWLPAATLQATLAKFDATEAVTAA